MSQRATIRPMTEADVEAITRIERDVFTDPWPRSAFVELLQASNCINLVLQALDGSVAGYILAQTVADEVQIQNIALMAELRQQGYGRLLLQSAESEGVRRGAQCAVLDVRANNESALALYHSAGYRMIGRRKNYYRRPVDDALILFRRLDGNVSDEVNGVARDGMVS